MIEVNATIAATRFSVETLSTKEVNYAERNNPHHPHPLSKMWCLLFPTVNLPDSNTKLHGGGGKGKHAR